MDPIRLILNVLWLVLGGVWMAIAWFIAGCIMIVTIIGIPWARSAFVIARYALTPFGYRAVRRDQLTGHEDIGTGPLGIVGNIIWLVLAGWWLALLHVIAAVADAITIVGLPFAWAHLKLAAIALWPIGMTVIPDNDYFTGHYYYPR